MTHQYLDLAVLLTGGALQPVRSTTDQDLGSDTSSAWNFCSRSSEAISRGKAGIVSRNVGCFARIKQTPTDFVRDFFAVVTIMVSSTYFGEEVCALRGKRVLIDKTQKLGSQSRSSARKRALYLTIIVLQRSKDSFFPPTKQSYPYVTYFIYKPWQDCTLQGCISASLPSHFLPPPLGAGLSHVLNRYCSPTPHDLLQGSHSCHSLQFPLTLNRKKKYT